MQLPPMARYYSVAFSTGASPPPQQVQVQVQVLPALYSDRADDAMKSASRELENSIFTEVFISYPFGNGCS
ncbi:MAG: hypothetical protein V4631_14785 [Pseudomonadota bacterium]